MSDAPLILSLETATLGGSVWLGQGKVQLAARNGNPQVSQSNSLLGAINSSLEEAGLTLQNVDVFACASGPGSFTGLRIGIATLKALAATLNRPCVGIPTLHAVAHAAGPSSATVALLPAGRGELFAQLFSVATVSFDDVVRAIDQPAHLAPAKVVEQYGGLTNLRWAGHGAQLQREAIEDGARARGFAFTVTGDAALVAAEERTWQLAAIETNLAGHVAALAEQAHRQGTMQRAESLTAIYVRPSDPELKELCK